MQTAIATSESVLELLCRGFGRNHIIEELCLMPGEYNAAVSEINKQYPTPEQKISAAMHMGLDVSPAYGEWADDLSYVELEILALTSKGISNRQIAKLRDVKAEWCNWAFSRIYSKLFWGDHDTNYNSINLAVALFLDADRRGLIDWNKTLDKEGFRKTNNGLATILIWELLVRERKGMAHISDSEIVELSGKMKQSQELVKGALDRFAAVGFISKTESGYQLVRGNTYSQNGNGGRNGAL